VLAHDKRQCSYIGMVRTPSVRQPLLCWTKRLVFVDLCLCLGISVLRNFGTAEIGNANPTPGQSQC
jgi:hypothetical protein